MIGDIELAGSFVLSRGLIAFDTATAHGEMKVLSTLASIAAGLGMTSGAHRGDADGKQGITQSG